MKSLQPRVKSLRSGGPAPASGPKWKAKKATTTERGYGSAWRKRREVIMNRDGRLCQVCRKEDRITEATEVDHVIPKSKGGTDDDSNLQAICSPCHATKSQQEMGKPAARPEFRHKPLIPVTVVCGPPGAGKVEYIRERATADDLVLDLDEIQSRIGGKPRYAYGTEYLDAAIGERNRRLGALARPSRYRKCWLIVGAPTKRERRHWQEQLNADVVLLKPTMAECMARISLDPLRAVKDWRPVVEQWFHRAT